MKRLLTFASPLASLCDVFTILIAAVGLAGWAMRTVPAHASQDVSNQPYVYLVGEKSGAAAWDCKHTISVAVNAASLPPELRRQMIEELSFTLETISARTPFRMTLVEDSTEIPTMQWGRARLAAQNQPEVIVFIGDPSGLDLWGPGRAAVGGSFSVPDGDSIESAFAGYAIIDAARVGDYRAGHGYLSRGALLTHELLHVLGLGHTRHPSSMMTPRLSDSSGVIGEGDITGLEHLAAQECG